MQVFELGIISSYKLLGFKGRDCGKVWPLIFNRGMVGFKNLMPTLQTTGIIFGYALSWMKGANTDSFV